MEFRTWLRGLLCSRQPDFKPHFASPLTPALLFPVPDASQKQQGQTLSCCTLYLNLRSLSEPQSRKHGPWSLMPTVTDPSMSLLVIPPILALLGNGQLLLAALGTESKGPRGPSLTKSSAVPRCSHCPEETHTYGVWDARQPIPRKIQLCAAVQISNLFREGFQSIF